MTARTTQLTSAPATTFRPKNKKLMPAPEVLIGHKIRPDEDTTSLERYYDIEQKQRSKIEPKHVATVDRRQPTQAREGVHVRETKGRGPVKNLRVLADSRRPASKCINPFHTDRFISATNHISANYTKEGRLVAVLPIGVYDSWEKQNGKHHPSFMSS